MNTRIRITSIDALRAVTLLGIIIVHTKECFGYKFESLNSIDLYCSFFINKFLAHKCNTIFSILFGVSFYLILRNPTYKGSKFLWRCFLLILIGLFNKLFYTWDTLMWYGFWGMCLVPIRNLKNNYIFIIFIILLVLNYSLSNYKFGYYLFGGGGNSRYIAGCKLSDIILYPYAIKDYLRLVFNGGIFDTSALFVLGYWLARIGVIENLKQKVTLRVLSTFWMTYLVSFIFIHYLGYLRILITINNYIATFAYSSSIIYLYYHNNYINYFLKLLEPYGKMGLTNYSFQGIVGILLMGDYGMKLYQKGVTISLIIMLLFFIFQALFSYYWLKMFRYGPMEYIWRVCTEKKFIPVRVY